MRRLYQTLSHTNCQILSFYSVVESGMPIPLHSRQDHSVPYEKHLIFQTAGQTLALPASHISEILPMIPLATVPMMPSFIAGFVDWSDGSSVS